MIPPSIPEPRPAATVLLLRDLPDRGLSVFMVQRSAKSRFMPGAYVFPGGAVERGDAEAGLRAGISPGQAVRRFGNELTAEDALGMLAAAARETEEEAGVALGGLASLRVFSHWVTPDIESRRFDTWFFAVRMPEAADAVHDDHEVVASRWVEPRAALERYGQGGMVFAPPTYYTLWDLARFDTVDDVLSDTDGRSVVAVQPRFEQVDSRMTILLPGDPLFPSDRPVDGPTRIVMGERGRWWVVEPG